MKGDFSRNTFNPINHFTRVLMQQGRVQVDADWNEQVSILLHYLQTVVADLIGPYGKPDEDSFKVETSDDIKFDFTINKGRCYVDGILIENVQDVEYSKQTDYPLSDEAALEGNTRQLVYLDIWERHINYIEDDSIREVALRGPDTTTRAKIVWQVKVEEVEPNRFSDPDFDWDDLVDNWQPENRGRLKAQAVITDEMNTTDPCITSPEARYRGPENQLYRVEIHQGGTAGTATFKWSRDNGSVVFPVVSMNDKVLTLEHLGHDVRSGLQEGDWVEIVDDDYVLQGRAEPLLKVKKIDRVRMEVTLDKAPISTVGQDENRHPLLRRWDQKKDPSAGANEVGEKGIVIIESTANDNWIVLEDGVYIQFQSGATYRTSDYWLIPARTETGDIEWPKSDDGSPLEIPPHGVEHHYAPLAIINIQSDGDVNVSNHYNSYNKISFESLVALARSLDDE